MLDKPTAAVLADAIERGLGLQMTIRYLDMFHWAEESQAHHAARAVEPDPRLESVADHTWHMSYIATLLLPYFPELDARRVFELTVVHDILELITGDYDPTGSDGLGTDAHSMNAEKKADKHAIEMAALDQHIAGLPTAIQDHHRALLMEEMACTSAEARFVKVIDKMQTLVYGNAKKRGKISDAGLQFLYRYRAKTLPMFPALAPLYDELYGRMVQKTADFRGIPVDSLWRDIEAQAA